MLNPGFTIFIVALQYSLVIAAFTICQENSIKTLCNTDPYCLHFPNTMYNMYV